jgi:hypothetical protein
MAGYQLVYVASYERVLLIIASVCLVAGAAAWFALRARTEHEELTLDTERS